MFCFFFYSFCSRRHPNQPRSPFFNPTFVFYFRCQIIEGVSDTVSEATVVKTGRKASGGSFSGRTSVKGGSGGWGGGGPAEEDTQQPHRHWPVSQSRPSLCFSCVQGVMRDTTQTCTVHYRGEEQEANKWGRGGGWGGRRRRRSGEGSEFWREASWGDREVDSLLLPPPDYASRFLWVSLTHSLPFKKNW